MKSTMRKMCLVLIFGMLLNCFAVSAYATENDGQHHSLGTDNNVSGYILDNTSPRAVVLPEDLIYGGETYHSIFSIHAQAVSDLLTSRQGSKSFRLNSTSVPSSATKMLLWGELYHSIADETSNYRIYYGVCYYDSFSNEYTSVYRNEARDGVHFASNFTIASYLSPNVTYYTYIKNDFPGGTTYVSGDLSIFYS